MTNRTFNEIINNCIDESLRENDNCVNMKLLKTLAWKSIMEGVSMVEAWGELSTFNEYFNDKIKEENYKIE